MTNSAIEFADEEVARNLNVTINRNVKIVLHPFTDYFKGFEKVAAVRAIFGTDTDGVLKNLKVEFFSFKFGYIGVSEDDGHILISSYLIGNSDFRTLYLDIIHELVHVKQFIDGKELSTPEFEFANSPTEIEAYRHTVNEARRIGMSDEEIKEYLKVEWIDDEAHKRLVESVGL